MTRAEAEQERDRLASEHPDRARHSWIVQEDPDGTCSILKVGLSPGARIDPLKATTEAKPKPPQPDDPRTLHSRHVGGSYV